MVETAPREPDARVASLWVYPVKSLRGHALEQAVLTPDGIAYDRRWMVVDPKGRMVTQRTVTRMATVSARVDPREGVLLLRDEAHEGRACAVPLRPDRRCVRRDVRVWSSTVEAIDLGEESSLFLRELLGVECALVFLDEATVRPVSAKYGREGDRTAFSDGFPMLLASTTSLASLNARLEAPVSIERFRANVVIEGLAPWREEQARVLRVGAVAMRGAKPCTRCPIIDVEPTTGARCEGTLGALSGLRAREGAMPAPSGKPVFGLNLLHDALGTLTVGDAVYVDAWR